MATIVNNPAPVTERVERTVVRDADSGMGFVIGLIVLILLAIVLFAYGIPALRNNNNGTNINVPDKVDVNLNNGNTPSQ